LSIAFRRAYGTLHVTISGIGLSQSGLHKGDISRIAACTAQGTFWFFADKDSDNPLLYWLIPIYWKPIDDRKPPMHMPWTHPEEFKLIDGVRLQTGTGHSLSE
jgi:hypothetical protein